MPAGHFGRVPRSRAAVLVRGGTPHPQLTVIGRRVMNQGGRLRRSVLDRLLGSMIPRETSTRIRFWGRIAAVRSRAPEGKSHPWVDEDIDDVLAEVAEYLRHHLRVPELERELVSRSQIDAVSLDQAVRWFEEIAGQTPPPFSLRFPDGTEFDSADNIRRLRDVISGLLRPEGLEEMEVLLRLGMFADKAFSLLLASLPEKAPVRAQLERHLLGKLALLNDTQATDLWARMRREVDPSRSNHIPVDPSVVDLHFFDIADAPDARAKVARYLSHVRPLLLRTMFDSGQSKWPTGDIGIATMLSWTPTPSTREWGLHDDIVIRSLGRLSVCVGDDKTRLAAALGVSERGYLLGGRAEQEARRRLKLFSEAEVPPRAIFDELEKLVRA